MEAPTERTEPYEELPPGRDAAFRRVVLEVYDYTCAACGERLLLGQDMLVEAAHIIPFSVGRNDKPTNGLALCPNHHWAMDRYLIAPCPDTTRREGVWRVSRRLDNRIHGQRELIEHGREDHQSGADCRRCGPTGSIDAQPSKIVGSPALRGEWPRSPGRSQWARPQFGGGDTTLPLYLPTDRARIEEMIA